MWKPKKIHHAFMALLMALVAVQAWAEGDEGTADEGPFERAMAAAIAGPQVVPILNQGELQLAEGEIFVPATEADAMMVAMGNGHDPHLVGIVLPQADEPWLVTVDYEPEGYISDDDANDWDADDLLDSLREGTEAMNEERAKMGVSALHVMGWVQAPAYQPTTHRLVWAVEGRSEGETESNVNYNTYALGREGYVSLNLITDLALIDEFKPRAHDLLGRLSYKPEKDYSAFEEGTDKVAAYGLAALVTGVAAKKLGMFAMLAALFVKFGKVALVAVAAGGAALAKFFKNRNS